MTKIALYLSYHMNTVNRLIHIVFVPILLWTGLSMSYYVNAYIPYIAAIMYSTLYMYIDTIAGSAFIPILILMLNTMTDMPFSRHLFLHILSWIVQILSHKYIEKQSPAIINGFMDSIIFAPFVVWIDLFWLIGYQKRTNKAVKRRAKYLMEIRNRKLNTTLQSLTSESSDDSSNEESSDNEDL